MTESNILRWIKAYLSPFIVQAIAEKGLPLYTENWFAGITAREVPGIIGEWGVIGKDPHAVFQIMRGDFTQRPGETEKQYHGYGVTQIDKASFPDFVKSGDWKDPLKCYLKTIDIMEGKRKYLVARFAALAGDSLTHYMTAAWNCGEGNEAKVISKHVDIDAYTAGHNYSVDVFRLAGLYAALPNTPTA